MRTPLLLVLIPLAFHTGASAQMPPVLIPWTQGGESSAIRTQAARAVAGAQNGLLLQGTVVLPPQRSEIVSMPVAGLVESLQVAPMQRVRAGQAVAQIVSPALAEAQREWLSAETQARLARSRLQRDEQLFKDGIIAERRLEETRANLELAELGARQRRQALRLTGVPAARLDSAAAGQLDALTPRLTVTAPVSGVVLDQVAAPGQRLEPGQPLARIARSAGRASIEFQASAQQAPLLHVGDTVRVEGCQAPARIAAISPQLSGATQSVQLRAELTRDEDCLRINQFVQLRWQGRPAAGQTPHVAVPAAAVVQQGGRYYVFVRKPGGFAPTVVTVGPGTGEQLLISAGLQPGDEVVVQGVAAIKGAWLGLGAEEK